MIQIHSSTWRVQALVLIHLLQAKNALNFYTVLRSKNLYTGIHNGTKMPQTKKIVNLINGCV